VAGRLAAGMSVEQRLEERKSADQKPVDQRREGPAMKEKTWLD
jgi:hypothetical protein